VAAIVTDSDFACTALSADRALVKYVSVWAYEFRDAEAPEVFLPPTTYPFAAAHASELQFLFNANRLFPNITYQFFPDPFPLDAAERTLSRQMIRYWTNFVRTLNPNLSGAGDTPPSVSLPYWFAYSAQAGNVQALQTPAPQLASGFSTEHQCGFWGQLGILSGF
jgi:para-nitrobenzyl esterase